MDILPEYTTVFTIPTPLVIYQTHIRFSLSCSSIHNTHIPSSLLQLVVPSEDITLLSFDSIIHSFGSQLESWSGGIVKYYMLETSILHYRVICYIPSSSLIRFTTFFISIIITIIDFIIVVLLFLLLFPALKLVIVVLFIYFDGHQSCHYFIPCDKLIVDYYVSHKNHCYHKVYVQ